MRDTTGKLHIAKIINLGQQKSSRKKSKKKNNPENKQETSTGVAKLINMFEEAPTRSNAISAASKPKIILEKKKIKKPYTIETHVKMTSPAQEKVKIASNLTKKMKSESPGLSTRMKPRNKADVAKLLKLVKPDEMNSPLKTSKFSLLIKSWELSSNKMLTPALPNTASLRTEMDSQLDHSLEDRAEIHPGEINAIGQENLESSKTLDIDQSADLLEILGENLNFGKKVEIL